jgi:putative addiction module component (TIGR02574 family)
LIQKESEIEVIHMTALAEKIYDEVLDLPTDQRLGLIDKLLESINPSITSIQEAWVKEAEQRLREYRNGKVQAVDGEKVFRRLQDRLSK